MGKHIFSCNLSKASLNRVVKDIEGYYNELNKKNEELVRRLAEIGVEGVAARIQGISPIYKGDDTSVFMEMDESGTVSSARIVLKGEKVLFIEFGTGITFNTSVGGSKHPKGAELGYTIGSYNPSSPNASNPAGWWYKDKWDTVHHSYGNPAFMPLWNTKEELESKISEIVSEVFEC